MQPSVRWEFTRKGVDSMNKSELIERVAADTGKTKKEPGMVVDAVLETISEALKRGEKVSLVGFGNFEVRERSSRTRRNRQTGETIYIEATRVPAFKHGKQLNEAVNSKIESGNNKAIPPGVAFFRAAHGAQTEPLSR